MSINIQTKDNKTIAVDSELIQKFSTLVKTALSHDKDVVELPLNIPAQHLQLAVEYMIHHDKKETSSPVPPLQTSWTVDNSFEDKWDSTFFKRVLELEKDSLIIQFIRSIEYLDMDILLKKCALVAAIGCVQTHGLQSEKLAESFNKLALSKKI